MLNYPHLWNNAMELVKKRFHKGISKHEFASKWEESREKMYRFAYCYVKNEQDALEILSEATCKAYCALGKLKEPEYFDSWMGQIIINTAIDYLKKQKRTTPEPEMELVCKNCEYEINQYEQAETRLDVYAALELIQPEERSYIILKYFEEKSFQEISVMTGIPESTVKTKIYRSLKKMREYWKNMEVSK